MPRYLNVLSAIFTDANPSTAGTGAVADTTYLGVQSATVNDGSSLLKSAGDGDIGPTNIVMDHIEPMVGLKFEDISPLAIQGYSGRHGKLVVVVGKSGSGQPGGITITLDPCVCLVKGMSAGYRKNADSDIEFHGICSAGNPLKLVINPVTPPA